MFTPLSPAPPPRLRQSWVRALKGPTNMMATACCVPSPGNPLRAPPSPKRTVFAPRASFPRLLAAKGRSWAGPTLYPPLCPLSPLAQLGPRCLIASVSSAQRGSRCIQHQRTVSHARSAKMLSLTTRNLSPPLLMVRLQVRTAAAMAILSWCALLVSDQMVRPKTAAPYALLEPIAPSGICRPRRAAAPLRAQRALL